MDPNPKDLPAFPGHIAITPVGDTYGGEPGMTLRDYAMIKFVAAWTTSLANRVGVMNYTDKDVAYEALYLGALQADAMIEARAK